MVMLFLVDGFEEIEALATVNILRRGGVALFTVSLTGNGFVIGSHNIQVKADKAFDEIQNEAPEMIILPGGPGTSKYMDYENFTNYIKNVYNDNKYVAAICAAPTILSKLGLLDGKKAVCFPAMESELHGAVLGENLVEHDGQIITSKAAGTSFEFALKLLEILKGSETAQKVKSSMLIK